MSRLDCIVEDVNVALPNVPDWFPLKFMRPVILEVNEAYWTPIWHSYKHVEYQPFKDSIIFLWCLSPCLNRLEVSISNLPQLWMCLHNCLFELSWHLFIAVTQLRGHQFPFAATSFFEGLKLLVEQIKLSWLKELKVILAIEVISLLEQLLLLIRK